MSNACFKAFRATPVASQLSSHGLRKSILPCASRDTFYARFFTVFSAHASSRRPPIRDETDHRRREARSVALRSFHLSPACQARRRDPKPKSTSGGPSVPFGTLSAKDIRTIFGYDVEPNLGNRVLKILHQRRVDGSLLDYNVRIEDVRIPEEALVRALNWLRSKLPVDEVAAGEGYSELQALKLQRSYISRAERLGLVKKMQPEEDKSRAAEEQGTGYSVIDQMRKYNEKREEKAAAERKASGEEQRSEELRLAKIEEKQTRIEALRERREQQQLQGMLSQNPEPPQMTRFRRLGPTTFLALCFVAVGIWAASVYEPPAYESRLLQSLPPSVATIVAIAAGCSVITFVWRLPIPRMWRFLNTYFISIPGDPHAFSILGNVFSHQRILHLVGNMSALAIFGISLHEMVGRGNFMAIYVLGGVMGSLASMYFFVLRNVLTTSSLGASGAIFAVASAWAVLNLSRDTSRDTQQEFAADVARYCSLTILIGGHFMSGVMIWYDVLAHVGGAVTGLIAAQWLKMRARASSRALEANPPGQREVPS